MTDFSFTLEPDEPEPPDPPLPEPAYDITPTEFVHHQQALLPPGAAWTRRVGALITKVLEGFAPELARVNGRAVGLLPEFNPATAVEMLTEHEEINGLPDPCGTPPSTTEARQAALAARLLDSAGHNPADYVAVAEALGHVGTTVHRRPYPPFRAGIGRAGRRIYSNEWAHVFGVAYMTDVLGDTWTTSGSSVVQGAIAPDGDADAATITYAGAGHASKAIAAAPQSVQFDVWMRVPSGTATVVLSLYRSVSTFVAGSSHQVDAVWRRYSLRGELSGSFTFTSARISAASEVVEVWGEKVGVVDQTLECRFETISQAHTVPEFWAIGEYVEPLE